MGLKLGLNVAFQVDLVEKRAKNWHEDGAVPSEPFFVARPGAVEEDDGESHFLLLLLLY